MHHRLKLSTKHSCTVTTVKDNGIVQTRYTTDITPRNEASRKRRRNDSSSEAEDEIFAVPESRKRNSAGPSKAGPRPSIQGISSAQNQENQEFNRIQQLETEVGNLKETVEDLKKTVHDLKQSFRQVRINLDDDMKRAALKALNELNTPKPRTRQMKQDQPSLMKTERRLTSNSQISSNTATIHHKPYSILSSTIGSPNSIAGNSLLAITCPPTPGRRTPSDTASTSEFDRYRSACRNRVRESSESSQSELDSRSKSQAELNEVPEDHEGEEESQASLPNSRSQSPADVSDDNANDNDCEDQESQQSSQRNNESRNGDSKESSSSASSSDENEDVANHSETEEETSQTLSGSPQFHEYLYNLQKLNGINQQYALETGERLRASISPTPSEHSGHTVLLNRNESTESGPSYGADAADNYEDLITVDTREIQPEVLESNDIAVLQNKSDNDDDSDNSDNSDNGDDPGISEHDAQPEIPDKKEARRKAISEKRRKYRLGMKEAGQTCGHLACTYKYQYQYEIERHMRTHTNDRPFRCTQCSRAYKEKHHLRRHVDKKHKKMYTSVNKSKSKK